MISIIRTCDELRTLRQSGMPLTDNRDAVQGNTLLARHKPEMANLTQWVNAYGCPAVCRRDGVHG